MSSEVALVTGSVQQVVDAVQWLSECSNRCWVTLPPVPVVSRDSVSWPNPVSRWLHPQLDSLALMENQQSKFRWCCQPQTTLGPSFSFPGLVFFFSVCSELKELKWQHRPRSASSPHAQKKGIGDLVTLFFFLIFIFFQFYFALGDAARNLQKMKALKFEWFALSVKQVIGRQFSEKGPVYERLECDSVSHFSSCGWGRFSCMASRSGQIGLEPWFESVLALPMRWSVCVALFAS